MPHLITAGFANALPVDDIPKEIVYIPEGEHDIKPFVDGKAGEIHVSMPPEKGALVAAAFQRDLTYRRAENVRPWIDFEHKRGKSAGEPTAFRYGELETKSGTQRGLIAAIDWSSSGKSAIEGKDFRHFSPSFLVDDDGVPIGLDERGPLGGLVNEPAFRNHPRIAAADASGADQPEDTPTMSKLIFAALAISAAAENAESEAVKAIENLKVDAADAKTQAANLATKVDEVTKERDEMKKKLDAAEAVAAEERKTRAKTLVDAAIADGRIAPKDEATADKFRAKIEAGDTFAEEALALLKPTEGPGKQVIQAGQPKPGERKTDEDESPYSRVEAAFAEECETAK